MCIWLQIRLTPTPAQTCGVMCADYRSERLSARPPTHMLVVLNSRSSVGASVCTAGYEKGYLLVQLHKDMKELAG